MATSSSKWCTVVVFATAMAWVESAAVFYLRTLVNRIEPYQPNPLPLAGALEWVELARELATMVMLLTVGLLAGRHWIGRLGYAAVAFGTWDIFYYLFLKLMCGWPHSLLDWDILFLIPLPWWGPVLAPLSISALMIFWGTLVNSQRLEAVTQIVPGKTIIVCVSGILLALYVFMSGALGVATQGIDAVRNFLPTRFNWPLFIVALVAMALPGLTICHRASRGSPPSASGGVAV